MMLLMGLFSDRTKMRRTAFAVSGILGALGWVVLMATDQPWPFEAKTIGDSSAAMSTRWLFLAGSCLAQAGMISMIPTFWVLPTSFLSGTAAAAGIALINSIGNLGGQFGPPLHGQIGHPAMIGTLLIGALLASLMRHDPTLDTGNAESKVNPKLPEA
jgi:ACS family tartrate transporter-like MFS transporter